MQRLRTQLGQQEKVRPSVAVAVAGLSGSTVKRRPRVHFPRRCQDVVAGLDPAIHTASALLADLLPLVKHYQ
jgi:hypothetical protein